VLQHWSFFNEAKKPVAQFRAWRRSLPERVTAALARLPSAYNRELRPGTSNRNNGKSGDGGWLRFSRWRSYLALDLCSEAVKIVSLGFIQLH
jgi:hypothetical protein